MAMSSIVNGVNGKTEGNDGTGMVSRNGSVADKSMVIDFFRDQKEALRANDAFGGGRTGCSSISLPLPLASDPPRFKNAAVVPNDTPLVRCLLPSELETSIVTGGSNAEIVRSFCELWARRKLSTGGRRSDVPNAMVLISEEEEEADEFSITWGRPSPKDACARAAVDFRGLAGGKRECVMASSSGARIVPLAPASLTGKTDSLGGVGGKSFSTMNLSRPCALPSSVTSTPNTECRTTGAGVVGRFFHSGSEKK